MQPGERVRWDEGVQPYSMPPPPNAQYGIQRRVVMPAGESKQAQLLEGGQTQLLWRVTAYADQGLFDLVWGTYGTNELRGLRSPLAISIPGAFTLQVRPINRDLPLNAVGALSVSSGGLSIARTFVDTLGPLDRFAARATALGSSTINVGGTAVAVAAGQSVDLCWPCALTAGGPLLVDHAL